MQQPDQVLQSLEPRLEFISIRTESESSLLVFLLLLFFFLLGRPLQEKPNRGDTRS